MIIELNSSIKRTFASDSSLYLIIEGESALAEEKLITSALTREINLESQIDLEEV